MVWQVREEAEKVFAKTYSTVYSHLQNFKDKLVHRSDQGKYYWEAKIVRLLG